MGMAFTIVACGLYGGRKWWMSVDSDYRNNKMYQADPLMVSLATNAAKPVLQVEIGEGRTGRHPLVPDHGKLMHLFLIKSGDMSAFAQGAVMQERRHKPRLRTLRAGKILFNNKRSVIDCMVRNASTNGACLN